jgi:hypothetical protein
MPYLRGGSLAGTFGGTFTPSIPLQKMTRVDRVRRSQAMETTKEYVYSRCPCQITQIEPVE